MAQCQAGLLVSGRKWLDFVSYVGGMPLFVKRVHPVPVWQEAIIAAACRLRGDRRADRRRLRGRNPRLPKTERIDFSHIDKPLVASLTETRGKRKVHTVGPLPTAPQNPNADRLAALKAEWDTADEARRVEIRAEVRTAQR
jgi:hypothetical protein